MITYEEARARVLQSVSPIDRTETVSLDDALGRVLAQSMVAPFNVPNHANSAMDGYGLRHADLSDAPTTTLTLAGEVAAGDFRAQPLEPGHAVRILTGAPIPPGCDCVVKQEDVTVAGQQITLPSNLALNNNIRPAGEDIACGQTYLEPGKALTPPDIGLLASMDQTEIPVFARLRVAVLSTGNEVTPAGQPLAPGRVYDSNRAALKAAITALGCECVDLGVAPDDLAAIEAALRDGAARADAVITSGGVSVGDYDLVKVALKNLGDIDYWKVRMKPGKPQAYGVIGPARFFGLPGNPVSAMAVYLLIVRPALLRMMGLAEQPENLLRLPLQGGWRKKHDRRDFLRARVHFQGAQSYVTTTGPQGSGVLSGMARANAFIALPESPVVIADGDLVDVLLIDYAPGV
ncbi:gephyrin-like molybdotransferase Glp [Magnetofaba australis]|uniref:Molybdopterin molybdenumtransferase n=1 Tax=Magnetofaba australis IT-1 TaxID=1434232 RepID=A0A1Y2K960_9PROT|nr:gephyrin-like molybdotransferase Glp [Magnetofaba australis]OSM05216.1 putative molybdopterin molybdochelatase [Magnetofaba australis IT-1]